MLASCELASAAMHFKGLSHSPPARDPLPQMGRSPLHAAVRWSRMEVVTMLLDSHADPALADKAGWTPLHAACQRDAQTILRMLLERGGGFAARALGELVSAPALVPATPAAASADAATPNAAAPTTVQAGPEAGSAAAPASLARQAGDRSLRGAAGTAPAARRSLMPALGPAERALTPRMEVGLSPYQQAEPLSLASAITPRGSVADYSVDAGEVSMSLSEDWATLSPAVAAQLVRSPSGTTRRRASAARAANAMMHGAAGRETPAPPVPRLPLPHPPHAGPAEASGAGEPQTPQPGAPAAAPAGAEEEEDEEDYCKGPMNPLHIAAKVGGAGCAQSLPSCALCLCFDNRPRVPVGATETRLDYPAPFAVILP